MTNEREKVSINSQTQIKTIEMNTEGAANAAHCVRFVQKIFVQATIFTFTFAFEVALASINDSFKGEDFLNL